MQYQSSCAPKLARKCGIEHWFPCGADGRAVYGHVITKFSGMGRFTYPWCSAGALHAPELRYYYYYYHYYYYYLKVHVTARTSSAEKILRFEHNVVFLFRIFS